VKDSRSGASNGVSVIYITKKLTEQCATCSFSMLQISMCAWSGLLQNYVKL
jgi:hypothetical protein